MISFRRLGPTQVWLAVVVLSLAGCASAPKPLSAGQRAAICQRAEVPFADAILVKPAEAAATNSLGFRLAPLFIVEAAATNSAEPLPFTPTVFFSEGKILLNGRAHDQVSFVWQPGEGRRDSKRRPAWQGIRITLNSAGQPAIWEVLRDSSRAELVFVSANVEAAARREFGSAFPGRRFAVERAVSESPNAVVARVIDDGPVPMGPIVHVCAGTGDISAVICRCMPSQAQRLTGQSGYQLLPAQIGSEHAGKGRDEGFVPQLDHWHGDGTRKFRLPAGF